MTQQIQFDLCQPKPCSALTDKSELMLSLLCEMGLSREMVACFLDLDRVKKDHIHYFLGPIVQHRSPWQSTTPQWLYEAVIPERLSLILEEHRAGTLGWKVGPAEIATMIYPASMDAPLQHEAAQIYLWATAQATARHRKIKIEEVWQMLGGHPVPDEDVVSRGGRYFHDYQRIASDIRRKVIAAQTARSGTPKSRPALCPSLPTIGEVQGDMFR